MRKDDLEQLRVFSLVNPATNKITARSGTYSFMCAVVQSTRLAYFHLNSLDQDVELTSVRRMILIYKLFKFASVIIQLVICRPTHPAELPYRYRLPFQWKFDRQFFFIRKVTRLWHFSPLQWNKRTCQFTKSAYVTMSISMRYSRVLELKKKWFWRQAKCVASVWFVSRFVPQASLSFTAKGPACQCILWCTKWPKKSTFW